MVQRSGHAATPHARIHLTKLCRHFSHKVPVEWNTDRGDIDFTIGQCSLIATATGLEVTCAAPDSSRLDEVMEAVQSHLERFAQREGVILAWV